MADRNLEEGASSAMANVLTLETLRLELKTQRDDIKAEIGSACQELKREITTLRTETKAEMRALHEELTGELTKLRTAQAETRDEVENMGMTLSETMDRMTTLEKNQKELTKKCKNLQDKYLDLENRSRRNNLRIVGVPEDAENGNMLTFIPVLLRAVLGEDIFSSPVVIDRAHRSLGPKSSPTDRPRSIVVRFHYYTDKQKVLDISKTKGNLFYNGHRVHLFPDVSPEVGRMRAVFNNVKRKFRDAGVTYSLYYPARFVVTMEGRRHPFDSPQAAQDFYDEKVAQK